MQTALTSPPTMHAPSAPEKSGVANRIAEKIEKSPTGSHLLYLLLHQVTVHDLHILERAFAFFTISTGLWMGWPINNQYKSASPIYQAMVHHLPPLGWTILFLICGVPALIGCPSERRLFNWICIPCRTRIAFALVSVWLWSFLSAIFLYDKSPGLSTAWAPIIALYHLRILMWLWVAYPPTTKKPCNGPKP